jgi:hypothetical protein
MTTTLDFSSSTTETVFGGTNYAITETGSGTDVTLNFVLPGVINQDSIQGADQTLNFGILDLTGPLSAGNEATAVLKGAILNNNGDIFASIASNVTINTKLLVGTGMTFIAGSTVTMDGFVGGGQTVDVGYGGYAAFFVIGNPDRFFGDVDIQHAGYVDLADLKATSYSYANDVLTLWQGDTPVDRLRMASQNGFSVSQVENPGILTSGVWVNSGEPALGTALPLHGVMA